MEKSFPVIQGSIPMVLQWTMTIESLLGISGISMLLWLLLGSTQFQRKRFRLLIILQAVPDLLLAMVVGPVGLVTCVEHKFPGKATVVKIRGADFWTGPLCDMYGFSTTWFAASSIYTLVLISWERYCAVIYPFTYRHNPKRILLYWIVIMASSCIYAMVPFFEYGFVLNSFNSVCNGLVGPGIYSSLTLALFVLAGVLLVFFYFRMFYEIRRSFLSRSHSGLAEEKAIAVMFFAIVAFYFLCWFLLLVSYFLVGTGTIRIAPMLLGGTSYCLGSLNALANPVLIICTNKEIRSSLKDKFIQKSDYEQQTAQKLVCVMGSRLRRELSSMFRKLRPHRFAISPINFEQQVSAAM